MILNYFQSNNFGDALNPYIFNHFLPNFFDGDPEVSFVGIGSILGLSHVRKANKKIVFSSGFAYGAIPSVDSSFDIFCVRGPLTCEALKINKNLAVSDGAILLQFMEKKEDDKKYKFSFIPHWESMEKFNWETICEMSDVHYIKPTDSIDSVLSQIKQSEVVIAEAMHGAIVADALRVPWIPVKAYKGINFFKWQDWASSLNLEYNPIQIKSLYNDTNFTRKVIRDKTGYPLPLGTLSPVVRMYEVYQSMFLVQGVVREFEKLKLVAPSLSNDTILNSKGNQLLTTLDKIKKKYSQD
ncbi:hypothetical protein GCM10011506_29240 [Marivirga lumbricoides]|uniref:Polysaccharide pyruvyl transferase domain-containing protein n=1 Tax=Marivirga lumbricoides TaxID=1046115 RepID=A0ABQ1MKK7_9BACT|nr:hypothetical protein GCM10011506_29240 [Marivirga lumbricoides]